MKKKIVSAIIAAASIIMLAGCSLDGVDIEDEVTEALLSEQEPVSDAEPGTEEKPDEQKQKTDKAEPETATETEQPEDLAPDPAVMTEEALDADVVEMLASEADGEGNSEPVAEKPAPDPFQVVFIGDSIFDSVRDETGIAYLVGEALDADIYNLSIGGTSAAIRWGKPTDKKTWTEPSLLGVIYTMQGVLANDVMDGYKAGEVIETLAPSKTDYFIIEYGTNDFLSYIPIGAENINGQYYYYFSTTLSMGITELKNSYPNARIILCTPYYEQFWSADRTRFIGDVHTVNNGFGTLLDYVGVIESTASDNNVSCLNMYNLMEIDTYSVDKMTVDGIHPNEEARRKYAGLLIDKINELEQETNE